MKGIFKNKHNAKNVIFLVSLVIWVKLKITVISALKECLKMIKICALLYVNLDYLQILVQKNVIYVILLAILVILDN